MSKNLQRAAIAIIFAAFIIRIWRLGSMPPAIHPDEMAGLAGMLDELQGRAPLRPFFDYRIFYLPLTGVGEYLSSLFFGYNAWAYRFPSAIYGVITVVATMGLTLRLTKDRLCALVAGAISAILPWEITVSRLAWENATMLPYMLGGLWAMRAGIEDRKAAFVLFGAALLGIDAYSYRAALPDGAILAIALLVTDLRRARASWRPLLAAAALYALVLAPLVVSVIADPRFFWRDAYIATFRDGVNATTLMRFAGNYVAHFDPVPLFFRGDGNAEHGPAFGVLYLWMLPVMLLGFFGAFRRYGRGVGFFLVIWLALYPLGGAITNDGVPHFLRTLIGAPLAAIAAAIGITICWEAIERSRAGRAAAALFAFLAFIAFSQFCQAYFITYVAPAADAFQYENRELFTTVRAYGTGVRRICFQGLDDMNARTLFSYYLRDLHVDLRERIDPDCAEPDTIVAVKDRLYAPLNARLLATAQTYEGRVKTFIFLTK